MVARDEVRRLVDVLPEDPVAAIEVVLRAAWDGRCNGAGRDVQSSATTAEGLAALRTIPGVFAGWLTGACRELARA